MAHETTNRMGPQNAALAFPRPSSGSSEEPGNSTATLASQLADAAAAQLLLFDELPADERPTVENRILLVGLVWGGTTLVELEQIGRGEGLAAGRLFDLPAVGVPARFRLVRHSREGLLLTVPAQLASEVHGPAGIASLAQLARSGAAREIQAPFHGHAYPVGNEDRIVVQVAPKLSLIVRYVRAARACDKGLFAGVDRAFAAALVATLVALVAFGLALRAQPRRPPPRIEDLLQDREHVTRFRPRPPEPQPVPPKASESAGAKEGAKAHAEEGKAGRPQAPRKEAARSRRGAPADEASKAERDRRLVQRKGLLAALHKLGATPAGGSSSVLGPGGLGTGLNHALGGVKVRGAHEDAVGVGGLGLRGVGPGGGGTALGLAGLGTKGSGRGRGGYGDVDLGGRGKEETQFIPGKTTVVGGLPREVINRVIQRHYNEIKYCYEKELIRDPGLYGKVTVLFVIGGEGRVADALVQQTTMSSERVESCMVSHVRRWSFPAPQGGGTVQVTYPWVFKSSGP